MPTISGVSSGTQLGTVLRFLSAIDRAVVSITGVYSDATANDTSRDISGNRSITTVNSAGVVNSVITGTKVVSLTGVTSSPILGVFSIWRPSTRLYDSSRQYTKFYTQKYNPVFTGDNTKLNIFNSTEVRYKLLETDKVLRFNTTRTQ